MNYRKALIVSASEVDGTDDEGWRDGHKFSLRRAAATAAAAAATDKMLADQP